MNFLSFSSKLFLVSIFLILFSLTAIQAQSPKKLKTAAERANASSEAFTNLAEMGADSIPMEYVRKAKAIAVIPNIIKFNLLFEELTRGKGIVSVREENGWSIPAFVSFGGAGVDVRLFDKEKFDAILLFMTDESVEWLKNGDINFRKDKNLRLGPVITGEKDSEEIKNAPILYYQFEGSKLVDSNMRNDFFNDFKLFHDNKMSKAIYKKNTKQLLNVTDLEVEVPEEVDLFRQTIKKYLLEDESK